MGQLESRDLQVLLSWPHSGLICGQADISISVRKQATQRPLAGVRQMIHRPPPRHLVLPGAFQALGLKWGFQAGHREPLEGHLRVMLAFCVTIASHYVRRHKVRSHSACRIAQVGSG